MILHNNITNGNNVAMRLFYAKLNDAWFLSSFVAPIGIILSFPLIRVFIITLVTLTQFDPVWCIF